MTDTPSPPAQPLLVNARTAARLMDLSPATWHRLVSAGKTPAPVRLTPGTVRWRRSDLESWIAAGCPDRAEWEAQSENDNGRPR